jgi:DNA repair protein RadC
VPGREINFKLKINMIALKTSIPEIQVTYKTEIPFDERQSLRSSEDSAKIFKQHYPEGKIELQEIFKVIFVNRANHVLGIHDLSIGGLTGTVVDIRILLAIALKSLSSGIVLAHNHPSGNIKPSQADISITKKISQACKLLEIQLLDHIIVTKEDYFSFADNGLL